MPYRSRDYPGTRPLHALTGAEASLAAARRRMVSEQLASPGFEIRDARVLAAMEKVPRHEFVPQALRYRAYEDGPLPIGYGQTISQPFIVALMTATLELQPEDRILEIGTGSGYQAAVLAELAGEVYTMEIIEPLARNAAADLQRLGYTNVTVKTGDGTNGWPEAAPFDAIIVTCAPDHVPQRLVDQLREGGRMIIPVGLAGDQTLYLLRRRSGRMETHAVLPVRFVPMTGAEDAA
jgi:protein-L-isoaspartate(D-aspartate) O-methyltransferase